LLGFALFREVSVAANRQDDGGPWLGQS